MKNINKMRPLYTYFRDLTVGIPSDTVRGEYRIIGKDGRSGINTTSIHANIQLNRHNLNEEKGSLTLWFLALEDLDTMTQLPHFTNSNPFYMNYSLLSDYENQQDYANSVFSVNWCNTWYPQLFAKFFKGEVYPDAYNPKEMAFVAAGHFTLKKGNWYQLCFAWDKCNNKYQLYMNGVLVGSANSFTQNLEYEAVGDTLFVGNPCLCISEICFYQEFAEEEAAKENYLSIAGNKNENIQESIQKMFKADRLERFEWQLTEEWVKKLDLSLTEEAHLNRFYVQGCRNAALVTKDGLLIETPQVIPRHGKGASPDMDQVYLWTDSCFEGDLYLEYEFMSLQEGGLGLLMFQASGMQREDFMKDYPLRTNGSMKTVTSEDVRNYHWEFYGEMNDVRNEISSHVLVKNPWFRPMGYVCKTEVQKRNIWHKLQALQEGDHIRCVIDGETVLDLWDDASTNNGPVLNFGRIAIRCMVRTKLILRNLKVYNKFDYTVKLCGGKD